MVAGGEKVGDNGRLLLTTAEAAQALGVGRTTLFRLLASGAVGSVRIGNCRRIPCSSLRAYVVRLEAEQVPAVSRLGKVAERGTRSRPGGAGRCRRDLGASDGCEVLALPLQLDIPAETEQP